MSVQKPVDVEALELLIDYSESALSYVDEAAEAVRNQHLRNGSPQSLVVAQQTADGLRTALAAVRVGAGTESATSVNAEMLAVLEELRDSAAYWSQYDVPLGIVDRINAAIANARGVKPEDAG